MKITILHQAVADSDSAAERDVLLQVAAVEEALRSLGHESRRLACTLNLEAIEEALTDQRPELVFNLVESLAGSDRLAHLAARLLEDLDLRYTGAPAASLHLANNKPLAKTRLRAAGLPTPEWTLSDRDSERPLKPPYIIKAVWEHASMGLDDHALIRDGDGSTIGDQIASRARQLGQSCFAEQFIEGREFNLSLLSTPDGAIVLPPAEIDFSSFPEGKPRIVGYAAKWEQEAPEYSGTPRKFTFDAADADLVDRLKSLAMKCWELFNLAGYARVDFRVDETGQPWILEVNANPCLSPDAGFAAALAQAELPVAKAVEWLLAEVMGQGGGDRSQESGGRSQGAGPRGRELVNLPSAESTQYPVPRTQYADAATKSTSSSAKKALNTSAIKLRSTVKAADRGHVRRIVEASGLFRPAEIDVAEELVAARLEKGAASGYEFIFAELKRTVVGYICFGRNTLTVSSYDIYWIAVTPERQGQGIGQMLLAEAERLIAEAGGKRVYIETSHRADYQATRGFYERCGYALVAVLEDFYAPGDSKATYVKVLSSATPVG